jgi:protein tyrosine phosphatase (PTP) superfamily phosphohydrolase (DUF442 family)
LMQNNGMYTMEHLRKHRERRDQKRMELYNNGKITSSELRLMRTHDFVTLEGLRRHQQRINEHPGFENDTFIDPGDIKRDELYRSGQITEEELTHMRRNNLTTIEELADFRRDQLYRSGQITREELEYMQRNNFTTIEELADFRRDQLYRSGQITEEELAIMRIYDLWTIEELRNFQRDELYRSGQITAHELRMMQNNGLFTIEEFKKFKEERRLRREERDQKRMELYNNGKITAIELAVMRSQNFVTLEELRQHQQRINEHPGFENDNFMGISDIPKEEPIQEYQPRQPLSEKDKEYRERGIRQADEFYKYYEQFPAEKKMEAIEYTNPYKVQPIIDYFNDFILDPKSYVNGKLPKPANELKIPDVYDILKEEPRFIKGLKKEYYRIPPAIPSVEMVENQVNIEMQQINAPEQQEVQVPEI